MNKVENLGETYSLKEKAGVFFGVVVLIGITAVSHYFNINRDKPSEAPVSTIAKSAKPFKYDKQSEIRALHSSVGESMRDGTATLCQERTDGENCAMVDSNMQIVQLFDKGALVLPSEIVE